MVEFRQKVTNLVSRQDVLLPENSLNFVSLDQEFSGQNFDSAILLVPAMLQSCEVYFSIRALTEFFGQLKVFDRKFKKFFIFFSFF
jgi:hypothetical protein